MSIKRIFLIGVAAGAMSTGVPAGAQETTTYSYDALGRLVTTTRAGGPNNGIQTSITFDQAGNRVTYNTSGSSQNSPPPGTPSPPGSPPAPGSRIFIVVPLSGFTLIPITVPGS